MPITIRKLASQLGVSAQTVSAILGDKGHLYRPETRQRVLEAAERLGYRPNAQARATRTGRTGNIALLVAANFAHGHLPTPLLAGVEHALASHNCHLTVAQLADEKLTDAGFVPKILREWAADGLLINYHFNIPPRMVALIRAHGLPSIWINSQQESDCVYPDERGAAAFAVEWLAGRGHRRVGYVDLLHGADELHQQHYSVRDRADGYEQAARRLGLEARFIRGRRKIGLEDRLRFAVEALNAPDAPTAIIAHALNSAHPVALAAVQAGRAIGRDIEIVVFEERPANLCGVIGVPTLLTPHRDLGERAVERLMRKLADPGAALPPLSLPFAFIAGHDRAPQPLVAEAGA